MSDYYILDKDNNAIPATFLDLVMFGVERGSLHVNETKINGVRVSTVFLGINCNRHELGSPHIFETMLFTRRGGSYAKLFSLYHRCSTYTEAEALHKGVVRLVKHKQLTVLSRNMRRY